MPKAYSYLRFSTPEQAQGDSFRRQTEAAQLYALKAGLELDTTLNLRDAGVSAFKGLNASVGALAAFLRAVDEGEVEVGSFLIVESLDRISRQTVRRAVRTLEEIVERGVAVVDLSDGERVYSAESLDGDPVAFMMMALRFIRAHEESALKSRRLKSSWENKRADAGVKPLTARAPAWLELTQERTWKVREDRAEVVRRIFGMAATGMGDSTIAASLNAEGMPPFGNGSRIGKHWHRTSVAKILNNPAVAGILIPHTQDHVDGRKVRTAQPAVEGHFPVIVPAEVRDAVLSLKAGASNPQRGRHAQGVVQNVLGGLAVCPICRQTMTRVTKGSSARAGKPSLVCTKAKAGAGCRYRAVPIVAVEEALITHAEWIGSTGSTGATIDEASEKLAEAREMIKQAEAMRDNFVDAIGKGISSRSVHRGLARAEQWLEKLQEGEDFWVRRVALSDSSTVKRQMEAIRRALETKPLDRQAVNVALREAVTSVVVQYGSGHLELWWKSGGRSIIKFAAPDDFEKAPEQWRQVAERLTSPPIPKSSGMPTALRDELEDHPENERRRLDRIEDLINGDF